MNGPRLHSAETLRTPHGSVIAYRRLGAGPALILLHGGMMAAQNFMKLGAVLADTFTVLIPDRGGRGASSPYPSDYSVLRDCEDVRALARETGATRVFGLSSGAIIALQSALLTPELTQVAAYEPPYSLPDRDNSHWLTRFDAEVARGDLAAAMVTVLRGTDDSLWLRLAPRLLLERMTGRGIRAEAQRVRAGDVPVRDLIPTMHFDALLVRETSPKLEQLRQLGADVLLLGGSQSAQFLKRTLDKLETLLPRARRVELRGVGHLAANNGGKPQLVAAELRRFFT